jgi:stress-induced morphogen
MILTSTPTTRPWQATSPRRLTSGMTSYPDFKIQLISLAATDVISRLVIISDVFASKMQPARHRMVYALLRDEMALEGGIHALQLTLTPEEEKRLQKKKAAEAAAKEESAKKQETATTEKAESKAEPVDA